MQQITIEQLASKFDRGSPLVIDVREPEEFETGHIPGARNVPMAQLPAALDDFDRSTRVHVVCASGNRSATSAEELVKAGFDAVSVDGGTTAWIDGGHPTESGVSR